MIRRSRLAWLHTCGAAGTQLYGAIKTVHDPEELLRIMRLIQYQVNSFTSLSYTGVVQPSRPRAIVPAELN